MTVEERLESSLKENVKLDKDETDLLERSDNEGYSDIEDSEQEPSIPWEAFFTESQDGEPAQLSPAFSEFLDSLYDQLDQAGDKDGFLSKKELSDYFTRMESELTSEAILDILENFEVALEAPSTCEATLKIYNQPENNNPTSKEEAEVEESELEEPETALSNLDEETVSKLLDLNNNQVSFYLSRRGFFQMYHLQTAADLNETINDLSKLGYTYSIEEGKGKFVLNSN